MAGKNTFWVTANRITKLTGMTRRELYQFRLDNIGTNIYKSVGNGFRYDMRKFPKELLKQSV